MEHRFPQQAIDGITTTLENSEAEAMHAFETAAPPATRSRLGMAATRIGGGVALAMSHDVTGYWNKALGFGRGDAPVSAELIADVGAFYRDHDVEEFTLQIAPELLPADWAAIASAHGLLAVGRIVKLAGDVHEVVTGSEARVPERPQVRVAPVTDSDVEEWGAVLMRGFGMPEEDYGPMGAGFAGLPEVVGFGAWLDGRLVGAASVRTVGTVAHLFGCAVLPEARRRGGQTALLRARARVARDHGCQILVGEAGAEDPGTHNPSLHNQLRAGLKARYVRTDWQWRARR